MNRHACRDCGTPSPTPRCAACAAKAPRPARPPGRHTGNSSYRRLRAQALERDGHQCAYCGRPAAEVDHIIPVSAGGPSTLHNLAAACRSCNRRKGAKAAAAA